MRIVDAIVSRLDYVRVWPSGKATVFYDLALLLPVAIVPVVLVIVDSFLFDIAAITKPLNCRHSPLLD